MESLVSASLAEDLLSWRNEPTDSTVSMIGKRIATQLIGLPLLLTVNVVETVVRAIFLVFFPLYACFSDNTDISDHYAVWMESVRIMPLIACAFIDNLYATSLDKDNGCLMHCYFKVAFSQD